MTVENSTDVKKPLKRKAEESPAKDCENKNKKVKMDKGGGSGVKKVGKPGSKVLVKGRQKRNETMYELGLKMKKIWEELRPENCPEKKRKALLEELTNLVKGRIPKLVSAHDTVRVIEAMVSMGENSHRDLIYTEIMESGRLLDFCKSKFGNFIVSKLLKYGTKERRENIAKEFEGKTAHLMKHKIANSIVECYYNDYANASRRNRMLQDFCGSEFLLFKDDSIRTVEELLNKYPDKAKKAYRHLFENVSILLTKGCYNHGLVHTVIYNFLKIAKEKERAEVVAQFKDVCVHILHTPDGAKASMLALWHGNNKERKLIMKSFRSFVPKIATEEHGHMVFLALFDVNDDFKFISATILKEFGAKINDIISNKYGAKVVQYLLAPRCTSIFHPDVIQKLKGGDGNAHSKKDTDIRQKEFLGWISPIALNYLAENADKMAENGQTILIATILNFATGDPTKAMEALASLAVKESEFVENAANHQMLKKIIQADKTRSGTEGSVLFSSILLKAADDDTLESWLNCNRGAFMLVLLIETDISQVKKKVASMLKSHNKLIKAQKTKGAECLRSKLGI